MLSLRCDHRAATLMWVTICRRSSACRIGGGWEVETCGLQVGIVQLDIDEMPLRRFTMARAAPCVRSSRARHHVGLGERIGVRGEDRVDLRPNGRRQVNTSDRRDDLVAFVALSEGGGRGKEQANRGGGSGGTHPGRLPSATGDLKPRRPVDPCRCARQRRLISVMERRIRLAISQACRRSAVSYMLAAQRKARPERT